RDFSHEERILRGDGLVRHLHSVGEVIRDQDGAAVRMLGVCLDVTERKEAEAALRESEQNVRMLLTGVRDYAIYMLDLGGHVRSWNAGAEQIKGYSADEIVGQHFRKFYTGKTARRTCRRMPSSPRSARGSTSRKAGSCVR